MYVAAPERRVRGRTVSLEPGIPRMAKLTMLRHGRGRASTRTGRGLLPPRPGVAFAGAPGRGSRK